MYIYIELLSLHTYMQISYDCMIFILASLLKKMCHFKDRINIRKHINETRIRKFNTFEIRVYHHVHVGMR